MSRFLRAALVLMILLLLLLQHAASQTIDIPPPTPTAGGGGGGGSRQIDLDRIYKALQEGKAQKPQKFEELKKLLYIEPFTTKEYDDKLVLSLPFEGNKTLNRTQELEVNAYLENSNPIEIRRALYLQLESLEPGAKDFRQVNSVPQIIQVNEYTEANDGRNYTYRAFPELTSFGHLKDVGPVVLRLKATDGYYHWTSANLTLNIINNPPVLSNLTIQAPLPIRYNDPIYYEANASDEDGDAINVTLHVLDEQGKERGNASEVVLPGDRVSFLANQHGFFRKEDAGRNFTYYYTYGDGINSTETDRQDGPRLKESTSIWVDNARVTPEEENQYWWQAYNFSIDMKNQDPGEAKVLVTLFTDTPAHPWKMVRSQEISLTSDTKVVYFNVKPFDVLDAGQNFGFRFTYSEYDQNQKDSMQSEGSRSIGMKLIKYEMIGMGLVNLLVILLAALLAGILVERRFYR